MAVFFIFFVKFILDWWLFWEKLWFFPPENGVSGKNVQKIWKFKKGVKTALPPLFKELWAIFRFLKFKNQRKASAEKFGD